MADGALSCSAEVLFCRGNSALSVVGWLVTLALAVVLFREGLAIYRKDGLGGLIAGVMALFCYFL